jgi:prepilin-type N-terminal cleavage/methylation domain-containing protein
MRLNTNSPAAACARISAAFTLIEMLVVLVIIGLLAALALPAIRASLESRAIDAASQQLLQDLSLARQRAIAQRSVVAVVFLTPVMFDPAWIPAGYPDATERPEIERLKAGAFTHYAFFQFRRVGEQPGHATTGYITEWKALPEKTFFGTNSVVVSSNWSVLNLPTNIVRFPFPFSHSASLGDATPIQCPFPYLAFDQSGRPVRAIRDGTFTPADLQPTGNLDISIARGAVFYARDQAGSVINLELQEMPAGNAEFNRIHVDGLTGRAQWIKAEVK